MSKITTFLNVHSFHVPVCDVRYGEGDRRTFREAIRRRSGAYAVSPFASESKIRVGYR